MIVLEDASVPATIFECERSRTRLLVECKSALECVPSVGIVQRTITIELVALKIASVLDCRTRLENAKSAHHLFFIHATFVGNPNLISLPNSCHLIDFPVSFIFSKLTVICEGGFLLRLCEYR